jgi:hypothetical protein
MKHNNLASFLAALSLSILLAACAGQQQKKVIFRPDAANSPQEPSRPFDSWEIINSQNGQDSADIPEWVRWHIGNNINEIEALDRFNGKYIFIGTQGGDNFNALQQWANGFTVEQDLPRLVTLRVERRLIASASLYPDDEYGEYFEFLIREISNVEFSGAVKEQAFWLKRKVPVSDEETGGIIIAQPQAPERYEFLVLISIDKETMRKQIQGIMAGIKTNSSPTRDQAAAIARIKNNFFEGF